MKKKTVVFIASDLRSGSTLLDQVLSNHRQIESVGELRNLQHYITRSPKAGSNRNWRCRCGETVDNCPFWSDVDACFQRKWGVALKNTGTAARVCHLNIVNILLTILIASVPKGLKIRLNNLLYGRYSDRDMAENLYRVFGAIADVTQKTVFVDSSKRPEQLYALQSVGSEEYTIKIIHLLRDGRAVSFSALKRSEEAGIGSNFFKTMVTWIVTNMMIRNLKVFFERKNVISVKYEDLCLDPDAVVNSICRQFEMPYHSEMTTSFRDIKHNVGGTPHQFTKRTNIVLDERWKQGLSVKQKALFFVFGRIVNRSFGYWT
jgi:hypothetical protein